MQSEPTKFCLDCDYPLDGLSKSQCPECGRSFDPRDDQTYRGPVSRLILLSRKIPAVVYWVLGSILLTVIAAYLALVSAGAGHGTYFFAKLLFPYSMYWANQQGSITGPMVALGLAQFPLYGLMIGVASDKDYGKIAAFALSFVHVAFATGCLNSSQF